MKIRFAAACIALAVAGTACPSDDSDGTGGSNTLAEGGTGDDTSATASASMTAGSMSSTSASTTATSAGSETAGGSETGPVEPQPNGSECMENEECISGMCFYIALLGGVCGDCLSDADCPDGGCSLPNPFTDPPMGAHCNMGEPGDGCMSDEVCQPEAPLCAVIIDVPGVLTASGCSECVTDDDCDMGMLCSPTVDLMTISGQKTCVEPGTVPNGQACDHLGTGNEACMSGICGVFDVMGLVQVGVCGECGVDADCPMGEVCMEPNADIMTGEITPPLCGPP